MPMNHWQLFFEVEPVESVAISVAASCVGSYVWEPLIHDLHLTSHIPGAQLELASWEGRGEKVQQENRKPTSHFEYAFLKLSAERFTYESI